MRFYVQSFVAIAGLCLVILATGCDSWKRADAAAGLALTPHVTAIKVDGKPLIRIRVNRAMVLIDQGGARVVDFHLQLSPFWFWEPDPESPEDSAAGQGQIFEDLRGPNALAGPGWRTMAVPPQPELDDNVYWQVKSGPRRVTLLSDTIHGLRWRKEFYLRTSGDLWITVELQNVGGVDTPIGAESLAALRGQAVNGGLIQRAWFNGQWFSRRLVEAPGGDTGFTFPPRRLSRGQSLRWVEQWWITQADAATQPAKPPPSTQPDF